MAVLMLTSITSIVQELNLGDKHCYLMQDRPGEQCDTFKPCIPSDHTTVSCEDGDVGCPEGEGTPPPPTGLRHRITLLLSCCSRFPALHLGRL